MSERLEDDIRVKGWDLSISAAITALDWVLRGEPFNGGLEALMERPEGERRAEWIARGGNPDDWPVAS